MHLTHLTEYLGTQGSDTDPEGQAESLRHGTSPYSTSSVFSGTSQDLPRKSGLGQSRKIMVYECQAWAQEHQPGLWGIGLDMNIVLLTPKEKFCPREQVLPTRINNRDRESLLQWGVGCFHKCQKKEKPLTMHNMTGNASTVSWMNLLIFMGHLLCQTLEKVTKQNRHVPILTVLKYGYFKLCVPDERRGNKVLLRSTKGSGLRGTDRRSRRHCEIQGKLLLLGTHRNKDQPEGWGALKGKKIKGHFHLISSKTFFSLDTHSEMHGCSGQNLSSREL